MKIIFTLDEAITALREKYNFRNGETVTISNPRPRPLLKSNEPHWLDDLARNLQNVPKLEIRPGEFVPNKIEQIKVLRKHADLGLYEAKILIEGRFDTLSRAGNRQTQFGSITLVQKKQGE